MSRSQPICVSGWLTWLGFLSLICLIFVLATNATAGERRALVIANWEYSHTDKLTTPLEDGILIAEKLRQVGFDVEFVRNLSSIHLARTIHAFIRKLKKDDESLIYYAGHGIQFEGENFLLGTDVKLTSEQSLLRETYSLSRLIPLVESRARTSLIFWDACRDNPLADQLTRKLQDQDGRRVARSGAAQIPDRSGNSLIMFAADRDQVAIDRLPDQKNSPFAHAIAKHMITPNISIHTMLARVTKDVLQATGRRQRPRQDSGLAEEFMFIRTGETAIAEARNYEREVHEARQRELQFARERTARPRRRFRVVSADQMPEDLRPIEVAEDRTVVTRSGAADKKYTEFEVLFGTSRKHEGTIKLRNERTRELFGGSDGNKLILGSAIVTIPNLRERGSIPTPNINLLVARIQVTSESAERHFTIAATDVLEQDEFIERFNSRVQSAQNGNYEGQAFVFIHGYNTSFDDAIFRTAQIAHDLRFDGPAVAFSWPSAGNPFYYLHDRDTSETSRQWLHQLLTLIADKTNATHVNIVAHSMGNRVALDVLSSPRFASNGAPTDKLKLNEIVFAAPDVNRTSFEQNAGKVLSFIKGGVTLYASASDAALRWSKTLAGGNVRAGDVPPQGPVILQGIDTIDVTDASSSFFSLNHTPFADRIHLVNDMRQLFQTGRRPPDARNAVFEPVEKYWRYVKN